MKTSVDKGAKPVFSCLKHI